MHEMDKHEGGMKCECKHHKVLPLLVFLFGLTFLLHAFGMVSERVVEVTWPVLVTLAGFMKLRESKCKCC